MVRELEQEGCPAQESMKSPIYVRQLSDAEQKAVEAGLRSSNAFVLRRCQILLASARGERMPVIARALPL